MYYGLPITPASLYKILNKIDALTSNFGGQIPPGVIDRNGFPSVLQPTLILKFKQGICIIHYQGLIYITNQTPMAVITSFNQIYKLVLDPWGNEM